MIGKWVRLVLLPPMLAVGLAACDSGGVQPGIVNTSAAAPAASNESTVMPGGSGRVVSIREVGLKGAGGGGSGQASPDASIPSGGSYSGMASSDYVQRAATEQRTQEMAAQRARNEALNSCLVGRGYQQFALTPEQEAHLSTLKKGTNEYLEYLYKLGTDGEVVRKQSSPAK